MSDNNEIIEAEFAVVKVDVDNLPSIEVKEDGKFSQVDAEFEYARANIVNILETSNEVLESTAELVKESEHPRMVEVYSGLVKNLADINKTLFEIREKKMKIKGEMVDNTRNTPNKVTQVNNNTIFVGSTEDLIKAIKG